MKKLVLGTAQFKNFNYGTAKDNYKLNNNKILEILNYAWDRGIKHFDTAPSYNSENIIGKFIKEKKISNEIKIITKIPSLGNSKNILKKTLKSVEISLKKLNIEKIYCLFVHNQKDFKKIKVEKFFFKNLKKEFKIEKFGFSVYDREIADKITDEFPKICLQFPYNIVNNSFQTLKKNEGIFFGRSIFLQGLLISEKIKKVSKELKNRHKNYFNYIKNNNIDPIKLSLDYIYNNKKLNYIIFGAKNISQIKEIVNYKIKNKPNLKVIRKIKSFFLKEDTDPRNWE